MTWEDFDGYKYEDIGSGIYIYRYMIDDVFFVDVVDGKLDGTPVRANLIALAGDTDVCNLLAGNVRLVEEYIARHSFLY